MVLRRPSVRYVASVKSLVRFVTVAAVALIFWQAVTVILGASEPWDSPDYLAWYVASLGLSAFFGYAFDRHAWRWGVIIVFAQLPVLLFHSGAGNLLLAGLVYLSVLALPAAIVAVGAASLKKLRQRESSAALAMGRNRRAGR